MTTLASLTAQRAAAGFNTPVKRVNARDTQKLGTAQEASYQQGVAQRTSVGAAQRFQDTAHYVHDNPGVNYGSNPDNSPRGGEDILNEARTGMGNTIDWASRLDAAASKAEDEVNNYYKNLERQGGSIDPAGKLREIQNARNNAAQQIKMQQEAQANHEATSTKQANESGAASTASSGGGSQRLPYGNRTSEEGKAANAAATGGTSNSPTDPTTTSTTMNNTKKMATKKAAAQTSMGSYLATLTPEQRALVAPIQIGMDSLDQAMQGVATAAQSNMTAADSAADETFTRQSDILNLSQLNQDLYKQETQKFLQDQMDSANQNLLTQRDQSKQWLDFQKQDETRKAEADKAKMVGDMAFAAAVNGGTYSSNSSYAISSAEMKASQDISAMRMQYGLKAADVDIQYTAKYAELNNTFMKGMIDALHDYRSNSLDIMGKRFASEDARAAAKRTASDNYTNTLNNLAVTKANAITTAMGSITSTLATDRAATIAQKQWTTDYNYRVEKDNRDFSVQQDQWNKEFTLRQQDAANKGGQLALDQFNKDNTIRNTAISNIRGEYNADPAVKAYEGTYKPAKSAWDAALSAYNNSDGTDKSSALDNLATAFKALTAGAQAEGTPLSILGTTITGKATFNAKDIPAMTTQVQQIFDAAKTRRDSRLIGLRADVQAANDGISSSSLYVTDTAAGLPYTPPAMEAISAFTTKPDAVRNATVTQNIGGKSYTGNAELLTRLRAADDAYFEDNGSHLDFKITQQEASDGNQSKISYGIELSPEAKADGHDYLKGVGLLDAAPPTPPPVTTGARTDRNNNPIAAAISGGKPNQFTKALDDAGIKWSVGDAFPGDSSMNTIRIDGDPVEGARAILANSNAIQNWYINHTGSSVLPKYGVSTNADFKKLSRADQNEIIKGIYKSEVGSGILVASI